MSMTNSGLNGKSRKRKKTTAPIEVESGNQDLVEVKHEQHSQMTISLLGGIQRQIMLVQANEESPLR